MPPEPVQEVAHRALLAPPAPSLVVLSSGRRGLGILGEPRAQKRLVASDEVVTYRPLEVPGTRGARLGDGGAHLAQQVLELSSPRLLQLFLDKGHLPQVVGIPEGMTTRPIMAIAGPAVMQTRTAVAGQDANRVQGSHPPCRMTRVVGQVFGAGDMRPLQSRAV